VLTSDRLPISDKPEMKIECDVCAFGMFLRVTAMIIVVIVISANPCRDGFGEYSSTVLS
jgi:hypothetical protein